MSKFDRYIVNQLLAVFGFFALVLVGIYWINRIVALFDDLIGSGQAARVFLAFSALALPNVIRLLLPLAAFVATLYAGNRLMNDSELVVMQATGFSPLRLARPVAVFGLLVAAMMLILSNYLVPMSRHAASVQRAEISESLAGRFVHEGRFTHPSTGVTLYIREISSRGELLDIFLSDDSGARVTVSYTARQALFLRAEDGPKLLMVDGMIQLLDRPSGRLSVTRFADFTYDLAALLPQGAPDRRTAEEMSTAELLRASPEAQAEAGDSARALIFEGHARLAEAAMALATSLLGFAALLQGGFSRLGLWRQIGLAIGLLIALHALSTLAAAQGPRLAGGQWLAYLAPSLGLGLALYLLWRAGRPRRGAVRALGGGLA